MTTKSKKPRENSDRTPTNWAFSILTTTTSDTDPSFIIDFEQPGAKYIFNAGENTIRAFSQSKWGLVKTEGVFLTGVRGQTSGGLSSLLMSLADCGPRFQRMQVFGPPGLKHLLASMRMYMYRDNLPVVSNEVPFGDFHPNQTPNPIFKDSNITVYAIPIYPSGSGSVSSSLSNTNASESSLKRKRSLDSVETSLPFKKQTADGSIISGETDVPMSAVEHSSNSTSLTSFSSPSFSPHTFSPTDLTPSQAQEWRDMMVNIMFPAVKSVKHDTPKNTGKGKDPAPTPKKAEFVRRDKFGSAAEDTGNIDDYSRPMLLKGYHSQLPRFTLAEAESPQTASNGFNAENPVLPSALSLSYLVVGPRIRGKFDGAKADAMAIPRPLRSKLAKGETIQFKRKKPTTSDSITTETETITVTPEELLAASVPAAAVLILDVPSPAHVPALLEAFRGRNGYARWTGWKDRTERNVEDKDDDNVKGDANANQQEMKMKDESDNDFVLRTVVHLCGEDVWENQMYREFIAGFGEQEETHHILSSKSHLPDPLTFTSSGYHQLKLNQLDPEIFKVPKWSLEADKNLRDGSEDLPAPPTNLTLMKCHTIIPMRPPGPPQKAKWALENDRFHCHVGGEGIAFDPLVLETTNTAAPESKGKNQLNEILDEDKLDSTNTLEAAFAVPSASKSSTLVLKPTTAAAFLQGRDAVKAFSETEEMRKIIKAIKGADVGIITLGTGSAVPGKYRNVSATVIQIPNYGNILLDCGEGTWGQLCRFFGTETSSSSSSSTQNVYQFLRDLKCIYISHVHADHHLGLAKVLRMRKKLHPQPIHPCYLVTIRPVLLYLRELSDLEDLGLVYGDEDPKTNPSSNENGVIPVLTPALHWKQADSYLTSGTWSVGGTEEWLDMAKSRANAEDMCRSLGLKTFYTVDVRHRCRCYGAVIRSEDGWSVVFSADTMPSDSLVYAGQGASVLIHEATMTDDQEALATQKAHSTVGQAITVGKRMRASNILLTHFSARQPKIPHQIGDYPSSSSTRDSASSDVSPFIVTAFDYANLTIGNMWKMQFYMAAIEHSYQEMLMEVGELEEAEEEEREKLARAGG